MVVTIETPAKGDQCDVSLSALGSSPINNPIPYNDSASSMDYINAQLVAHGFVQPPGIVLGKTTNSDLERIVKCLLGMLSQRVEDMSRTEELTTKFRTLTYDYERMVSLHKDSKEAAANAEREVNVHKSRLIAANRALQASEVAHKQTTAELQRTRTILQGVRTTHQTELKKKEKDIERMVEKWSKIVDAQVKLMTIPSGLQCANVSVLAGSENMGNCSNFLEVALQEAEKARDQLSAENLSLRRLVLNAINEIQSVLHQVRPPAAENAEEPAPFTLTTLFPLYPPENANAKLNKVLTDLRGTLTILSQKPSAEVAAPLPSGSPLLQGEIGRLQNVIRNLQEQLEQQRQQSVVQAEETRAMFDKFVDDHRAVTDEIGEISVELLTVPLRDAEQERLNEIKKDLDQERRKFTEAAIQLGKERAEIQTERINFMDERRSWQVEMMLAELPPTPFVAPSQKLSVLRQSPKKSPRKSPTKVRVGKASTSALRKTTRVSRRSSLVTPPRILPSFETEVLPPLPALSLNPKPLTTSLLPTSFVLPPPSPHTSLPTQPAILASTIPSLPREQGTPPQSTLTLSPTSPENEEVTLPETPPPAQRLFPVAKPLAQRMIHAYSPAKPSPLSRILMLGNSPDTFEAFSSGSEEVSTLKPVVEEDERIPGFRERAAPPEQMSLAAELGIPESPPDSPLQEKKVEQNVVRHSAVTTTTKGRALKPDPRRFTAQEKGKTKATRAHVAIGRSKENNTKAEKKVSTAPPRLSPPGSIGEEATKPPLKPNDVSTSRSRRVTKLPPTQGGPRRVLMNSDEAPPVGKSWRG
ncbi:hypothetical protein E4T56_gene12389 [Termitomyces sp. T112]|nr:hypothetical protein C0989_008285 [Termitomyces sp. Mn162]KAG5725071.1 hypothetical protein E4T56_gene12389 [Termitomyces sp. T112]